MITYDDWLPDSDVSCALPDLRYVLYMVIGVVVAIVLMIMATSRLRHGK